MELMTIEEVSAEYRLSPNTLRYWRHRGEGPASFRLGRRVMFRRSDVDDWVQKQYEKTSSTRPAV